MAQSDMWKTVAHVDVLQPHGKAVVRVHAGDLAIVRQGDVLHAFSDSCPHSGSSLCSGKLEGGHVQCPAHGLRFRLTDGLLAGSPPGSGSSSLGIRIYPARIDGENIQIAIQP